MTQVPLLLQGQGVVVVVVDVIAAAMSRVPVTPGYRCCSIHTQYCTIILCVDVGAQLTEKTLSLAPPPSIRAHSPSLPTTYHWLTYSVHRSKRRARK